MHATRSVPLNLCMRILLDSKDSSGDPRAGGGSAEMSSNEELSARRAAKATTLWLWNSHTMGMVVVQFQCGPETQQQHCASLQRVAAQLRKGTATALSKCVKAWSRWAGQCAGHFLCRLTACMAPR